MNWSGSSAADLRCRVLLLLGHGSDDLFWQLIISLLLPEDARSVLHLLPHYILVFSLLAILPFYTSKFQKLSTVAVAVAVAVCCVQ